MMSCALTPRMSRADPLPHCISASRKGTSARTGTVGGAVPPLARRPASPGCPHGERGQIVQSGGLGEDRGAGVAEAVVGTATTSPKGVTRFYRGKAVTPFSRRSGGQEHGRPMVPQVLLLRGELPRRADRAAPVP